MHKVVVLQARMNSSRLPGKVLLPLSGQPIIWHILERIKRSETTDRICVATTNEKSDDILVEFCQDYGVDFIRGSEDDVLSRYIFAGYTMKADIIVRTTGDNPLVHPESIDDCAAYLESHPECDYACQKMLPLGTMAEAFTLRTLDKVDYIAKDAIYREHVTYYLHARQGQHGFSMHDLPAEKEIARQELRLTVDTQEDYELMTKIYDSLYKDGEIIALEDVIRFLDANPDLLNINKGVIQIPLITQTVQMLNI